MRIVCPACQAEYDVPPPRLAGHAALRCAGCGHAWALDAAASGAEPPGADQPDGRDPGADPPAAVAEGVYPAPVLRPPDRPIAALPDRPPPAMQPRRDPALALAWALSLAVVAASLVALVVEHAAIARLFPPAQRLYAALGLGG